MQKRTIYPWAIGLVILLLALSLTKEDRRNMTRTEVLAIPLQDCHKEE